jgi:hypothetical protein
MTWTRFLFPALLVLALAPFPVMAQTPTPTATSACCPGGDNNVAFSDAYSSNSSLNNYIFYTGDNGVLDPTYTGFFSASGGNLLNPANPVYASEQLLVTNSNFNSGQSNYTVQCDAKAEAIGGLFGVMVRAQDGGNFYDFVCNNGQWQFERHVYAGGSLNFVYLGTSNTPAYTAGTFVHMTVVACGNNFLCYVNLNNGAGNQLLFNDTDSTFTSGSPGIRSGYLFSPNENTFTNYQVNICGGAVPSPTPTVTAAPAGSCYIYPSPARGNQATLSYQMAAPGKMEMILWNQNREKAADITDTKPAGAQTTAFSLLGFSPGVYLYSVTLLYDSGAIEQLKPGKFAVIR